MDSEPIREICPFSSEPVINVNAYCATAQVVKEETAVSSFPTWKENFQDLSGWCMTSIQGRCEFPVGESVMASKLTDFKSEDINVWTSAEDMSSGLIEAIGKKINSGVETIVDARQSALATCVVLPQLNCNNSLADQQQQQQQSIINDVDDLKNNSNVWTDLSTKVDMDSNTTWQQLNNVEIPERVTELPLYYQQVPIIDVETKEQQVEPRKNQGVFQNLENVSSNGFDLFSYLCEDDISSPCDSISTDSSREIKSLSTLSNSSLHTVVSPKTYEPVTSYNTTSTDILKCSVQADDLSYLKKSPISSTSLKSTISICPSSSQLRTIVKKKKHANPTIERRLMKPMRTWINSDSSHDSTSKGMVKKQKLKNESDSDESHRDTREKNNEASRKSRMNKKAKEQEMSKKAIELEKDNRILKIKVEELEKLVSSMRNALLRSALKKEIKSNMF